MGYALAVDRRTKVWLCNNVMLWEFTQWAQKNGGYYLKKLTKEGWVENPPALRKEIKAIKKRTKDEDILFVLNNILRGIRGENDPESLVIIHDEIEGGDEEE